MRRTNGIRLFAAVALALVIGVGSAQAQQNQNQNPNRNAPQGAQDGKYWDNHFAACLLLGNDNEIQLAKLAEKKASDKDVKDFAKQMVTDHEKFAKDLERFVDPQSLTRRHERWKEISEGRRQARTRPNAHPDMHFMIGEELADQCLVSAQKELSDKSGEQFDDCYIGIQLGAHMMMLDEMKVFARHASPDLQKVLKQGEETAQRHFDHAKKIMKSLDDKDRRTASKDENKK